MWRSPTDRRGMGPGQSGHLPGQFLLRVGVCGSKIFLGMGSTGRFYLSLLCGLLHRH